MVPAHGVSRGIGYHTHRFGGAPLPEQSRIVARVTELRALCAELRQRLADAQATQSRLAQVLVDASCAG